MLKLNQIFLIHFLIIFSITLVLTALVSFYTLKYLEIKQSKEHIRHAIELVTLGLKKDDNLDFIVSKIKKETSFRTTFINNNGLVLAESHFNKFNMGNHRNRKEIVEAKKSGLGEAIRYSSTLNEYHLYIAKKIMFNGEIVYIRIASSLPLILEKFNSLLLNVVPLFAFIIFIGMVINYRVSKRIGDDLNTIKAQLEQIESKDYKIITTKSYSNEFSVITKHLVRLSTKLQKRDKQKQKYTAKLRLMNKQRNMLVSSLSHEFKNPIASMIGYAQTLYNDPACKGETRERFLQKIVNNGQKINTMLDRISLVISLDNDDFELKKDYFDINDVVSDAVLDMEKKYKERDIIYRGSSKKIYADKTLIELVIINLIDNALKYSNDDVEIVIEKNSISVRDKGIGIAESEIDKITKKFYRVDKNIWDNSMGLGLSIVSFILKAHSFELNIKSKENIGSEFSVIF